MTANGLFLLLNSVSFALWATLGVAVARRDTWLRDRVVGRVGPLLLSLVYLTLLVLFMGRAPGGFGSLPDVQRLFTSPWIALAGWTHYLAFDLFIGAWIAREVMEAGLRRRWLIGLLPLTFMAGPVGLVAFGVLRSLAAPTEVI